MHTIQHLLKQERIRHASTLNLIASENYPSHTVRAALASIASTKYAEGTPGRRYYGGCFIIDNIERAAQRAYKKLLIPNAYQAEYDVNVQPHAGSQANFAVYQALLAPGDTILSMSLQTGGHLTHGHAANLSGKTYRIISYGLDNTTELLDYNAIASLAERHRPRLIIAGSSAYARTIHFRTFKKIAQNVGAFLLADISHIAGLIATDLHPHPLPHADIVTSTTHKTLRGPRGALIINRNTLTRNINRAIMPGTQGGPFMHAIAAKAIAAQEAQKESFLHYQKEVLACTNALAHELQNREFHIVNGGTDTHMFMINLAKSSCPLTGLQAEHLLEQHNIIVNRNMIPGEKRSPQQTSGIRIGLAAMVTRGMQQKDIPQLAVYIDVILRQKTEAHLAKEIITFAHRFPLPV